MIIVRVMGGLGNQMFQYAFCQSLREKGKDARLDLAWYEFSALPNGFELEHVFSIDCSGITASNADCERLGYQSYLPMSWLRRLKERFRTRKTYYESSGRAAIKYFDWVYSADDMYVSSYWQSPKYFVGIEDKLRKDFRFSLSLDERNRSYEDAIKSSPSVGVHVRLGDYIGNKLLGGICTLDYYERAFDWMRQKVSSPRFFIFSNDADWCMNHLGLGDDDVIVTGNFGFDSYIDMYLMSICKNNIIANSSFSWWGAWLNKNPNKLVVAPKRWMNLEGKEGIGEIIPHGWCVL